MVDKIFGKSAPPGENPRSASGEVSHHMIVIIVYRHRVCAFSYVIIVMEETNSGPNMSFNVSSLRTFRVLRALKTISVVPGMSE